MAGVPSDYEDITDNQYVGVALGGILIGLIPIIVANAFSPFPVWLMLLPYAMGHRKDVKIILEAYQDENN